MKNISLLALITFCLFSCKTFIQVIETDSTNTTTENELFTYENDTLKIIYSFWGANGIMSFAVYNKLNIPLYIDWKKSSFISNSKKLTYWVNKTTTDVTSYYGNYYYTGPLIKPQAFANIGKGVSNSTSVIDERISFIPPQSYLNKSQFLILPGGYFELDINSKFDEVPSLISPKLKAKIYYQNFNLKNNPLKFRNFLSFSITENFQEEFYVDNAFFIKSVKEMSTKQFKIASRDEKGNHIFVYPHKKPTSFYLVVPTNKTIDYKK